MRKELAVFCLVYNLVRVVMLEAARRQDAPVARISFADALHWMRHARPGDVLPALMLVTLPAAPHRAALPQTPATRGLSSGVRIRAGGFKSQRMRRRQRGGEPAHSSAGTEHGRPFCL